jgi:hypothetical protein
VAYSKEEIKAFESKDLRIARESILKPLIEKLDIEDVYNVPKVTELCEQYIEYVYKGLQNGDSVSGVANGEVALDWRQIAEDGKLPEPNETNIKILDLVVGEYKKVNEADINPLELLVRIVERYGTYPTKKESISKVLSLFEGD